jgi:hypothetical protein
MATPASDTLSVVWRDAGREPQCAPNPDYPDGIDVDGSMGAERTCSVDLPYPAKRCGTYIVRCSICGLSVGVTTAGRPDDPRSVKIPCNLMASA